MYPSWPATEFLTSVFGLSIQASTKKTNALFGVHWKRIILDEAHVIKNPKAATSVGICQLKAGVCCGWECIQVHYIMLDSMSH